MEKLKGFEYSAEASGKVDGLVAEAAALTREIEQQLRGTGLSAAKGSVTPPPLSRMKKAQLVEECEARKLSTEGSVAELRAQLRVERKRQDLIDELVERGWSQQKSKAALVKAGWDLERAIADLA